MPSPQEVVAGRMHASRPPAEYQHHMGFMAYWAWLFVWAEYPLALPATALSLTLLAGLRVYALFVT